MKSQYADRDTVGSIYQQAQKNSTQGLLLQDVGSELAQSLVDDLNESIASNPFEGKDFYINVVEERDLQMKNAIKRRLFVSLYRPYPEDNTLVFHVEPNTNRVSFCWDIPHHSELPNILINEHLYDKEYVQRIKQWLNNDLTNFGFVKVSMSSGHVEGYEEKTVNAYREAYYNYCKSIQMDDKALETEKKLGFFWIPNKFIKDKELGADKPRVSLVGV